MKENLKVKINSVEEREEAQNLFHSMGSRIFRGSQFEVVVVYELMKPFKEITLPELRELARPKEYLTNKFELVVTNQPDDGFILVPDGSEYFVKGHGSEALFFYKHDGEYMAWKMPQGKNWIPSSYTSPTTAFIILWQRENKVETVKGRFLHQWAYEAFGRGEELEYIFNNNPNDVWEIVNCNNVLLNIFNASTVSFRLKPQTIQIGSRTINKPISVKPEICTEYFMPSLSSSCKYLYATWNDSNYDKEVLGRSLCHLTKEDAISHCEALLELMK